MIDLIKREDAIKMVGMLLDKTDDATDPDERTELESYNTGVQGAINMIKHHVPSADRPKGKWIAKTVNYHSYWICSECGSWALLDYHEQMCLSDFCPNCGAKMKGADDGDNNQML